MSTQVRASAPIKQLSTEEKLKVAYNLLCVVHREARAGSPEARRFIAEAIEDGKEL